MDCEICGRKDATLLAIVEGVEMNVCEKCSKYGKVISSIRKKEEIKEKRKSAAIQKAEIELEVVEDYAEIIKKEREKRGMTIKQLASALAEKESYLERVEKGETVPNEKLARKIEKFFNVKLLEEVIISRDEKDKVRSEEITVGDIIEIKKKK